MDEDNKVQEEQAMRLYENRKKEAVQKKKTAAPAADTIGSKISAAEAAMMLTFGAMMSILLLIPIVDIFIYLFATTIIYLWMKIRGLDQKQPWFVKWSPASTPFVAVLLIIIFNTAPARRWLKTFSPI